MQKTVIFLGDGMADEPLPELNGMTPVEAANTPNMDSIAKNGANGTLLTLPEPLPTSSDVANLSVLGYDPASCYPGRGPIEAMAQDIELADDDVAWRCNLVHAADGKLIDYSAGHIDNQLSQKLMLDLQKKFGNDKLSFYPGVSYRNLLIMHGREFSDKIDYHKPDSSQGMPLEKLQLKPADDSRESINTVKFINELIAASSAFLESHPASENVENRANMIWPWSPGRKPQIPSFRQLYGCRGAVISAVDVIFGIAKCTGMDVIRVPGATGFIDTNYEGKAQAAIHALQNHELVYLHVEAIDECGHMGDLKLKMQAIEDFDSRIVGPVMQALQGQDVRFAVLPDHPVPVKLRKHTRTPVPVAICGPGFKADDVQRYSEQVAAQGSLGHMVGQQFMKRLHCHPTG